MKKNQFSNIKELVMKNIKVLTRSKASSLVIFLGPLFIIFLVGISFDNYNTVRVNIGVSAPEFDDYANSFIEDLTDNQFKVVKYTDEQRCIDGIKQGDIHTCMHLSGNYTIDNKPDAIVFYVDFSRINLVWNIMNLISSRISSISSELSLNLTNTLVDRLENAKFRLENQKPVLISLATENDNINKKIEEIYQLVDNFTIAFDPDTIGGLDLSEKRNSITYWFSSVSDLAAENLEATDELITILKSRIAQSNMMETDKQNITAILDDADTQLGLLRDRLGRTMQLTDQDLDELQQVLNSIVSNLDQTKIDLGSIDELKVGVISDLEHIKRNLDGVLVGLVNLQKTINTIEESIESVNVTDPGSIVYPIKTVIKPVSAEKTYLDYLFPSLIVIMAVFSGILISSTLVIMEKKSKASFRNYMLPVHKRLIPFSIFLTGVLVVLLQLIVMMLISLFFFGFSILSSFPGTLFVLLLLSIVFSCLGMIVGYSFNSEVTSSIAALTLGSILLFLSDTILPLEAIPPYLSGIIQFNPFVIGASVLKKVMIFNVGIFSLSADFYWLLTYIVLFGAAVYMILVFRKDLAGSVRIICKKK